MNYKEVIETLFDEFRDKNVQVVEVKPPSLIDTNDHALVAPLKDAPGLWLVCKFGRKPDCIPQRSLEVVSPERFAKKPWNEHDDVGYRVYFSLHSNRGRVWREDRERIWLNYKGWASSNFNPCMAGAAQILGIHVRLQELLKTAKPERSSVEEEHELSAV